MLPGQDLNNMLCIVYLLQPVLTGQDLYNMLCILFLLEPVLPGQDLYNTVCYVLFTTVAARVTSRVSQFRF